MGGGGGGGGGSRCPCSHHAPRAQPGFRPMLAICPPLEAERRRFTGAEWQIDDGSAALTAGGTAVLVDGSTAASIDGSTTESADEGMSKGGGTVRRTPTPPRADGEERQPISADNGL